MSIQATGIMVIHVERTTIPTSIRNPFHAHSISDLAVYFGAWTEFNDLADAFVAADLVVRCRSGKRRPGVHHEGVVGMAYSRMRSEDCHYPFIEVEWSLRTHRLIKTSPGPGSGISKSLRTSMLFLPGAL